MTDLYLRAATQADMDEALTAAGLIEEGQHVSGVCIDVIGTFTRFDCSAAPPVETHYPEWHVNLRGSFNKNQMALLAPMSVEPTAPYRVWA